MKALIIGTAIVVGIAGSVYWNIRPADLNSETIKMRQLQAEFRRLCDERAGGDAINAAEERANNQMRRVYELQQQAK